jgi:uncharacterized integral membrane protein
MAARCAEFASSVRRLGDRPLLMSPAMADSTNAPGVQVRREGTNWRYWLLGTAAVLLAIFVFQNSQTVEVDFLLVNTSAPLIVALLIAGALGAVIGYVLPLVRRHRREERRRDEGGD